jgi:dolichol-phosphate mannosyltransferase
MTTTPAKTPHKPLLSIVLPAYNEQDVLQLTYNRFTGALPAICSEYGLDYELIFVNDGSKDRTPSMLDEFTIINDHVRAVHLARNFGHQAAITAGMNVARGDLIAIMDCDLQDPPEVLPRFLEKWREGYQVIFAVRRKRKEWFGKRFAYWSFYRLMRAISELDIPLDSGDFCLMDRSALTLLNSLPERQRFVRGLRTWVGLKQVGVEYERDARAAGVPQYTFRKLLKLAADGLVSFSSVPLKMVTRAAVAAFAMACVLSMWVMFVTIRDWDLASGAVKAPRGWASLAIIVLLMGSLQLLSIGIIGEYLSRIFVEVKGRPTFMIGSIVERGRRMMPDPRSYTTDRLGSDLGQPPALPSHASEDVSVFGRAGSR